jgi:hypothetical protein
MDSPQNSIFPYNMHEFSYGDMSMKRFVWLTIILIMLSLAVPVSAQQLLTLETVQVQFWPEFDRPEMLVIYTIDLPEDIPLPVNVTLRIPSDAGEPNAVAVAVEDRLLTAEYTRTVDGDWADIVVVADSTRVHVEYYDSGLTFDNNKREFDFAWLGTYPVSDFIVRVQAPVGATEMDFSEVMEGPQVASDGLGYYLGSFGSLDKGEGFDFSLSYQKSDNLLSFDALSDTEIVPAPETTGQGGFFSDAPPWVWVIVGIGVVLIGMGGWSLISDSGKNSKKSRSTYKKKRSRAGTPDRASKKPAKFCHNCGTAAQAGDKFCRECGQKLRV